MVNKRVKRLPSYPLVTVDPYFSIWSPTDKLYNGRTVNWTGIENQLAGYIKVDGMNMGFQNRTVLGGMFIKLLTM